MSQQSVHCVLTCFSLEQYGKLTVRSGCFDVANTAIKRMQIKTDRRGLKWSPPQPNVRPSTRPPPPPLLCHWRGKQPHVCQQLRTRIMFFTGKQMVTSPHRLLLFIMGCFPVVSFENCPWEMFYFSHNSSELTLLDPTHPSLIGDYVSSPVTAILGERSFTTQLQMSMKMLLSTTMFMFGNLFKKYVMKHHF